MTGRRGHSGSSSAPPVQRPLIAPLLVLLFSALVAWLLASLAGRLVGVFGFLTLLVSGAAVLVVNRRAP